MADYYANLDANYRLRLWVGEQSQNVAANQTTLVFALILDKVGSYTRWSSYTTNSWSANINGSVTNGSGSYDFRNYSSLWLLNYTTVTVTHNADGTKTVPVSASWNDATNAIPDGSLSGNYTITTIPRASTPRLAAPIVQAGTGLTVYTDRASTGFTHDVQIFFGNIATTVMTGVTDSYTFTVPMSYLNEMTTTARGFGTLRLVTKSGGTQIGYKDVSFGVDAPASVAPTLSTVTATEATPGLSANVGKFVQNITTLAITTSGASEAYGSPIVSTKIEVAGQTINNTSGTTAPINASGDINIVATVTDSRGRTGTKTLPINLLPYAAPKIVSLGVFRSTQGGVAQEDGTYITVKFTATVSSLMNTTERNARLYQIRSLNRSTNTWTVNQAYLTVTGYTSVITRTFSTYAAEGSYDFEVAVKDDFMTTTALRTVSVAKVFMHWNGSVGMGLGKYHENGMLDVAGDGYFSGALRTTGQSYQNGGFEVLDQRTLATVGTGASLPMTGNRHGDIRMTRDNQRYYWWDAVAGGWRWLGGMSPFWQYSELNDQTAGPNQTTGRYWSSFVADESMNVRVTITSGMYVAANAAMDLQPWVNGLRGVDNPKHTVHSNGKGNIIIPFTYRYTWGLTPGTHQLGFGYYVHGGSSSNVTTTGMQVFVERIPG